jgi:hypothetical protein
MMPTPEFTQEAVEITSFNIDVRVLRIGGKRMPKTLFHQIPEQDPIEWIESTRVNKSGEKEWDSSPIEHKRWGKVLIPKVNKRYGEIPYYVLVWSDDTGLYKTMHSKHVRDDDPQIYIGW